jgi:hypothetical protein
VLQPSQGGQRIPAERGKSIGGVSRISDHQDATPL